jgi:hypothetical protein
MQQLLPTLQLQETSCISNCNLLPLFKEAILPDIKCFPFTLNFFLLKVHFTCGVRDSSVESHNNHASHLGLKTHVT